MKESMSVTMEPQGMTVAPLHQHMQACHLSCVLTKESAIKQEKV